MIKLEHWNQIEHELVDNTWEVCADQMPPDLPPSDETGNITITAEEPWQEYTRVKRWQGHGAITVEDGERYLILKSVEPRSVHLGENW